MFSDGSLYLTKIQLIYGGKYQCHAQRNKDVVQTHILTVHSKYLYYFRSHHLNLPISKQGEIEIRGHRYLKQDVETLFYLEFRDKK